MAPKKTTSKNAQTNRGQVTARQYNGRDVVKIKLYLPNAKGTMESLDVAGFKEEAVGGKPISFVIVNGTHLLWKDLPK